MSRKIDGLEIAREVQEKNQKKIKRNKLDLRLAVVFIGNDKVSLSYIAQKRKAAEEAGVQFSLYRFPLKAKKQEVIKKIKKISESYSGVIVQLPLKKDEQEILDSVPENKDIDVLSSKRLGRFYTADFSLLPPVVGAVKKILEKEKVNLQGKKVAVIGSGKLVGKPLAVWLMHQKATVFLINEFTENKKLLIHQADIVVSGVGCPGLIKAEMIKNQAIIIDAGSCFKGNKIQGDFSPKAFSKASLYTPVPKGVGPITAACLVENLIRINEN
jgi:methylenetetrahydrofolate dehydrogenase (NADP+) / methenyltetrahydrofolate cyclohydrolase